eukprot:CAMPEP_0198577688 /NCGR_PEP_ID=MMETSP1462-20131121/119226_1 /TAXON_ID=1333877 /ORGANISM="Brandtodinium nutriculum, Strain RCC3387" /LENGTH=94 /DNA_ID=CAMNT_0044308971 /DNA_START=18 /DNA_END=298 /DNA_ORIENTATION=+
MASWGYVLLLSESAVGRALHVGFIPPVIWTVFQAFGLKALKHAYLQNFLGAREARRLWEAGESLDTDEPPALLGPQEDVFGNLVAVLAVICRSS